VPVWQRDRGEVTPIWNDRAAFCQNLLEFAEEIIIFGCVEKTSRVPMVTFVGTPENERNTDCPIRFRAHFREDALPKENSAKNENPA